MPPGIYDPPSGASVPPLVGGPLHPPPPGAHSTPPPVFEVEASEDSGSGSRAFSASRRRLAKASAFFAFFAFFLSLERFCSSFLA